MNGAPQGVSDISTGDPTRKGYRCVEASQFIEFCVDLDSQDDRMTFPNDPRYCSQVDASLWKPTPIYDSRIAVARDVIAFHNASASTEAAAWAKLYREILARAAQNPPIDLTESALSADPRYNGFGPYQSAWLLYEGCGENAGSYGIAIRGTVFAAQPSVIEDVLFHPVRAAKFLSAAVSFAAIPKASVHSGFAHATFSVLLDDRYGILRILHDKGIADSATLFIVGHSQGAAMATLTHAFFHYALQNATVDQDAFGLSGKNYTLKSYAYAQPKPGNFAFAADFARITQHADNAIVINNAIDPVPQVPLTLQDLGDIDGDIPVSSWWAKLLHHLSGVSSGVRGFIGRLAEIFVKSDDAGYGYYYRYPNLGPVGKDTVASSWNFTPAGHVLLVYGTPGDPSDPFLQHHAWTYRNLIKMQLATRPDS